MFILRQDDPGFLGTADNLAGQYQLKALSTGANLDAVAAASAGGYTANDIASVLAGWSQSPIPGVDERAQLNPSVQSRPDITRRSPRFRDLPM